MVTGEVEPDKSSRDLTHGCHNIVSIYTFMIYDKLVKNIHFRESFTLISKNYKLLIVWKHFCKHLKHKQSAPKFFA